MLMPDVTAILDDPEIGGGVSFQVTRCTSVRYMGGYRKTTQVIVATGNIQPQDMSNQPSTAEDQLTESIAVYSTFAFQTGSNTGSSIVEADIIAYDNANWRVTRVENWSKWGFTKAYATKTMDVVVTPSQETTEG